MLGDGAAHLVDVPVVHVDGVLAVEEAPVERAVPNQHVGYRAAQHALQDPVHAPLPQRRVRRVVPLLRIARRQHHLRARVQPRQLRVVVHRRPVQRCAVPPQDLVPRRRLRAPLLPVLGALVHLKHVVHIPHAQQRQRLPQRGRAGAAEARAHHLQIHRVFACPANPSLVRRFYLPYQWLFCALTILWRGSVCALHNNTVFFYRKDAGYCLYRSPFAHSLERTTRIHDVKIVVTVKTISTCSRARTFVSTVQYSMAPKCACRPTGNETVPLRMHADSSLISI